MQAELSQLGGFAKPEPPAHEEESEEDEGDPSHASDVSSESDYTPSQMSELDTSMDSLPEVPSEPHHEADGTEPKYIVFKSSLVELLSLVHCPCCGGLDVASTFHKVLGTLLIIHLTCENCGQVTPWKSQPFLGVRPAGNILLSASILFAGASATKTLRVLSHMGVATFSTRSFFHHQKDILCPAVKQVWQIQKTALLSTLLAEGPGVVLGGDGRADSPGHSAKYGAYTMLELQTNQVIDVQLVQVHDINVEYYHGLI